MPKKLFPKSVLLQVLNDDIEQYEGIDIFIMTDDSVDTGRWSDHRYMVFNYGHKFYGVNYSRGLTENQDERPFEFEPNMIECEQVEEVEIITIEYRPVKD